MDNQLYMTESQQRFTKMINTYRTKDPDHTVLDSNQKGIFGLKIKYFLILFVRIDSLRDWEDIHFTLYFSCI